MPNVVRRTYEHALPRLLAEDQARGIDVASFPHMKREDQRKLIRSLNRQLKRAEGAEKKVSKDSPEEAQRKLAARGIKLNLVSKKKDGEE